MRTAYTSVARLMFVAAALGRVPLSPSTAMAQEGLRAQAGPFGLALGLAGDRPPIIAGMSYVAYDEQGLALETTGAVWRDEHTVEFPVKGPAAQGTAITARVRPLECGLEMECRIGYSGPPRRWNPWTCGFKFDFGRRLTEVKTEPVVRWVEPTGHRPWEVPGDAPYPETEYQLREVMFGETALVMVSPAYDPDWIYGGNKDRARFWRLTPPAESPGELTSKLVFLVLPRRDLQPQRLAGMAAGRPMAIVLTTGRVANLFAPGEQVPLTCRLSNLTPRVQRCQVIVDAHGYSGRRLAARQESLTLSPLGNRTIEVTLRPMERGIVFVTARLKWEGGECIERTTIGILPVRSAKSVRPDSPFGMAAITANPAAYPDQFDLRTVLPLLERIGVRWIRGGWFPLTDEVSPESQQVVKERVELLRNHGILPHVQLPVTPADLEPGSRLWERLEVSLRPFAWVTPYVEVGNELNLGGLTGSVYAERLLKPVHDVVRRVHPEAKILSMGLGGVQKDWLNDFAAAGGMELLDILSVHPGCHPRAPEFWEGWRGWVFRSQMLDATKIARQHGDKQVWITEAYAPTSPHRSMVDLRTAADYLVRTYVCALALGVRVIEWYQFQDGTWFARRQNPEDVEYNFGIVYADLTPKPAYVAYGVMTEELEGAVCQGRLDLGADDLYGVRFLRRGEPIDVLWSYRERHETDLPWWPPENYEKNSRKPGEPWEDRWQAPVMIELPAISTVSVKDIMGNEHRIRPQSRKVSLKLTGSPVYVRGLGDIPRLPQFWPDIE